MKKPHIPLETLQAQAMACHACPLADGRTNVVFGTGNPQARVLIVGEAPGKNEDLQGVPFVGAAGQYLNELLAYAGLRREGRLHRQCPEMPPAGKPQPAALRDRGVHAVFARADAHHRPAVHRDARQLRHEVHPEDRPRHHGPARASSTRRASSRCSRSSIRRRPSTTVASGRIWRMTSPRLVSTCCRKALSRARRSPWCARPRHTRVLRRRALPFQGLRPPLARRVGLKPPGSATPRWTAPLAPSSPLLLKVPHPTQANKRACCSSPFASGRARGRPDALVSRCGHDAAVAAASRRRTAFAALCRGVPTRREAS